MKKNNIYPFRTRFAEDIVAEVLLPERQTGKVAILCVGLPSSPSKRGVMEFLVSQGYVAVFPRYRGTWESEGTFLKHSPAQDIADVIRELSRKKVLTDVHTGERHRILVSAIHLYGSSFGGPAVLLNSRFPIVKKIIAVSPVIDWKKEGEDEPFHPHVRFVREGFGGAYRTSHPKDWDKLITTDFYDPISHTDEIDGRKVFIIHATDDRIVPYGPLLGFVEKTGASYYLKPHGGHSLKFSHKFLWKKIESFIRRK